MRIPIPKRIYLGVVTGTLILLGLLIGEYFSQLMYLSYKAGLVDRVSVNGAQLIMGDGWFPLFSDKSWLGRVLTQRHEEPGAFFLKTNGWKPGTETSMIVSTISLPSISASRENQFFIDQTYRWGQAKILKEDYSRKVLKDSDYKWVVVVEASGLVLHVKDLSTLDEIKEIQQPNEPSTN